MHKVHFVEVIKKTEKTIILHKYSTLPWWDVDDLRTCPKFLLTEFELTVIINQIYVSKTKTLAVCVTAIGHFSVYLHACFLLGGP
jgi:hypothetical protein